MRSPSRAADRCGGLESVRQIEDAVTELEEDRSPVFRDLLCKSESGYIVCERLFGEWPKRHASADPTATCLHRKPEQIRPSLSSRTASAATSDNFATGNVILMRPH